MILIIMLLLPLITALVSGLFAQKRVNEIITVTGSSVLFVLAVWAAHAVLNAPQHILIALPGWIALGPAGAVILVLISLIALLSSIYSIGYMRYDTNSPRTFHVNFNLFVFALAAIPLSINLGMVWIAVEMTTLFSVLLVGFDNTPSALEAAWKYMVLTMMGAALALFGILLLYWGARHANMGAFTWSGLVTAAPSMPPVLITAAFIMLLVGLGTKIGLVPMHTWLPDAHSQAPTPVCALLSGIETTAVLYVLLRVLAVVHASNSVHASNWLLGFGLLSLGVPAFLLLQVKDYKRMLAFSTVEHMGIILIALGLGGSAANQAAFMQIIGHAVTKSFWFFAAGSVLLVTNTREIASVHGLIKRSPGAGIAMLTGGLAIAGAPPFILFFSEFSILKAGLLQSHYLVMGLTVSFIAVAFFAIMNHVSRMVFGGDPDRSGERLPGSVWLTLVLAIIPVIVLGLYIPDALHRLVELAATIIGG